MDIKIQKLNQEQFKESEFQEKVYQIVKRIRPGKTMSYKEVAEAVGSPRRNRRL